jgi:hypothetical protein
MAITSASGGFNGNWSPVIYSKTAQIALRKTAVTNAITNNSYFGEIANQGDTVRIQKEPDVTVNALQRHTGISVEKLDDQDFSLVIDKANYFAFKMDDIEEQFSHVDFSSLAADRAAYKMADKMDEEVLGYLSGYAGGAGSWAVNTTASGDKANSSAGTDELLAANKLDATDFGNLTISATATAGDAIPLAPRLPGATALSATTVSPLTVIARMARLLDVRNVDSRGRWIVVDPVFMEVLKDEDSRLLNADFGGSGLQNGLSVTNLHGFRVYTSNNLPSLGTGASTVGGSNATNFGVIVAGHDSAVATAEQINKTETYRDPDSFADIVRGMHLYGRKILRPEAIVTAAYNLA